MIDFIEKLKSSKNIFLKTEGDTIEKWKSLPHNKEGLDLFLKFNIVEIDYDGKSYYCTSNVEIINRLLKVLGIADRIFEKSFQTKRNIVLSWNLISDKIISFSMKKEWNLVKFITVDAKNLEILNSVLNETLKK